MPCASSDLSQPLELAHVNQIYLSNFKNWKLILVFTLLIWFTCVSSDADCLAKNGCDKDSLGYVIIRLLFFFFYYALEECLPVSPFLINESLAFEKKNVSNFEKQNNYYHFEKLECCIRGWIRQQKWWTWKTLIPNLNVHEGQIRYDNDGK